VVSWLDLILNGTALSEGWDFLWASSRRYRSISARARSRILCFCSTAYFEFLSCSRWDSRFFLIFLRHNLSICEVFEILTRAGRFSTICYRLLQDLVLCLFLFRLICDAFCTNWPVPPESVIFCLISISGLCPLSLFLLVFGDFALPKELRPGKWATDLEVKRTFFLVYLYLDSNCSPRLNWGLTTTFTSFWHLFPSMKGVILGGGYLIRLGFDRELKITLLGVMQSLG
jgi:hypothetical protein